MIDRDTINAWSKGAHHELAAEGRDYDFTDVLQLVAQKAAEAEREACAGVAERSAKIGAALAGQDVQDYIAAAIRARGTGGAG